MDPEGGKFKRFEDEDSGHNEPHDIQPPLYSIDPNVYQQDHNYTLGYQDSIPESHTTLYAPQSTEPSTFNAFVASPSVTVDIPAEQFKTYQQGGTYQQGSTYQQGASSPYQQGGTYQQESASTYQQENISQLAAEKMKAHGENIQQAILSREYQVTIRPWFGKAWEIFKQCWWGYMLTYLIMLILFVTPIAHYFSIFLALPLVCGIYIASSNSIKNGTAPRFGHMFHGVLLTIPLFILQILSSIAIGLGFLFCIIPGIFLSVAFSFAPYVYVEFYCNGISVLDALALSFRMTTRKFFGIFFFLILDFLLAISGVILLGVGILVTGPIATIAMTVATQEIFGLNISKQLDRECIIGM